MTDPRDLTSPIAIGKVRFVQRSEGGRRSGPPHGPHYVSTVCFDRRSSGEALPKRLWNADDQVTATFDFEQLSTDGWRGARVGFLAPELVADELRAGSRWLVMEGPRVVGELLIMSVGDAFADPSDANS